MVAKEKHPPGLVGWPAGDQPYGVTADSLLASEFAPPRRKDGDLPGLVAYLKDSGLDDLSEITVDGASGSIAARRVRLRWPRLGFPLLPGEPPVVQNSVFEIPKKAKKIGKTEGLAALPDGDPSIACDRPEAGPARCASHPASGLSRSVGALAWATRSLSLRLPRVGRAFPPPLGPCAEPG